MQENSTFTAALNNCSSEPQEQRKTKLICAIRPEVLLYGKSDVGRRQKSEDRKGEEAQPHLPSVKAQLQQASGDGSWELAGHYRALHETLTQSNKNKKNQEK